jgi:Leucine carboxyl methyltransferase
MESRVNDSADSVVTPTLSGIGSTSIFTLFAKARCSVPFCKQMLDNIIKSSQGLSTLKQIILPFEGNKFALINSVINVGARAIALDRLISGEGSITFCLSRPELKQGLAFFDNDLLKNEISNNINQVVSMASGLSTISLYYPYYYGIDVIETDREELVELKKEIITRFGLNLADLGQEGKKDNFSFVVLDVLKTLDYNKLKNYLDTDTRTLFTVEGLACYFKPIQVISFLENIKSVAKSGDIVAVTDIVTTEFLANSDKYDKNQKRKEYGFGDHTQSQNKYFTQIHKVGFEVTKIPYSDLVSFKEMTDRMASYYPDIYELEGLAQIENYFNKSFIWLLYL